MGDTEKRPTRTPDLAGQRFGKLVVECFAGIGNHGSMWQCKCDCGAIRYASTGQLRGKRKVTCCEQCGKANRAEGTSKAHLRDLTGCRFGKLTVLQRAENRKWKVCWLCQCDCGSPAKPVEAYPLTHGKTVDCGCGSTKRRSSATSKVPRDVVDCGDYMYFETKGHRILFDHEDIDVAQACHWTLDDGGYCSGSPNGVRTRFHRAVLGKYENIQGFLVDHKNGDRDDCRKSNLRRVTYAQNSQNSQAEPRGNYLHKGVYHTKSGKWCVQIRHDGIVYNLGTYADFDEACRVRDEEELKRFGEYSRLSSNAELRTSGGLT